MHSHAKLLTVKSIDPHTTLGIVVHTLNDTYHQVIHTQAPQGPLQDIFWRTIKGFLKVEDGQIASFVSNG